jgi:hypothetical protein
MRRKNVRDTVTTDGVIWLELLGHAGKARRDTLLGKHDLKLT